MKFSTFKSFAAAMAFLWGCQVHAADTPVEQQTPAPKVTQYKVPESTPIDRLVQKVYANSPLNTTLLRKMLVDANPKVITGNPQQRVKAGTTIVVPDHSEVVRLTLAPFAAAAQEAHDNNPGARDSQARKQWVRFP
jgi:hypothetical protein